MASSFPLLRAALAGIVRGPVVALAAGRYLDAVADRHAAEFAHTNAASGGERRYAAMDALTRARGAETTAAGALARALGRV